jgi:NADH-quinone oxidoreductase subunit I
MQGVSAPSPSAGSSPGLGRGLLSGLVTTGRAMLRPAHTGEYPDVKPALPPRSRGVIALQEENCTSCMLCARECPDWCIYIDSHKETVPAEGGGRERQRNVLDRFAIDFSLCMYCGICIEVCPFDALFWSPEFEYSEFDVRDLLHEKERLGQWMASVPPPPLPDPRAPQAREVAVAHAAAAKVLAEMEAARREGDADPEPEP